MLVEGRAINWLWSMQSLYGKAIHSTIQATKVNRKMVELMIGLTLYGLMSVLLSLEEEERNGSKGSAIVWTTVSVSRLKVRFGVLERPILQKISSNFDRVSPAQSFFGSNRSSCSSSSLPRRPAAFVTKPRIREAWSMGRTYHRPRIIRCFV